MKAAVYNKFGPPEVVKIVEVEKPVPKSNEVLIKIRASTVTTVDSIFRNGKNLFARLAVGITKPKNKIQGSEFSGVIEEIGDKVTKFNVGDHVFGPADDNFGCHAEYKCLNEEHTILTKPDNLSLIDCAAVPSGALTAVPFLRDGAKLTSSSKHPKRIVIIGASGSVGTYAVQIAKYYGAHVTGVCSAKNIELVKSIGADEVIDYTKDDFTNNGKSYDVVFDTIGKNPYNQCKNSLSENGIYLTAYITWSILFQMLFTTKIFKSRRKAMILFTGLRKSSEKTADLKFIKELIESNKIKPVIDKKYPLEQITDAHKYVDTGHKKGNVIITLG
ncbi:MAG: NAD(P)-dependent alcohol dehydrogenase [Ignavibacteriae bacterium]|nr:NAD(P)-dependent alcohol dehydrogenase [Ignavibacteriota bacterium]NOG99586.1 NAD(P)-dependent alcohol dehydrogenase [Ignavibacteriota bacterium]